MGLTDKLKAVAKQAQDAVGEHADKLHDAVDSVGVAVNEKTQGKYAQKIAKVGEKTNEAIDKFGGSPTDTGADEDQGGPTRTEASSAATAESTSSAASRETSGAAATSEPPPAPAGSPPPAAEPPPADGSPSFDQ
jgi:hypothetical protein